jgi:hypothetical protein
MKTIEGYRIVLEVDPEWLEAIAQMTEYVESGELCRWVSTEEVTTEIDEEDEDE